MGAFGPRERFALVDELGLLLELYRFRGAAALSALSRCVIVPHDEGVVLASK